MRKMFLLSSLFDEFFNSDFNWEVKNFPKENDPNFNKSVEEVENDTHVIKNETWTSVDGKTVYKRQVIESKKRSTLNIEDLKLEMKKAADEENYEKAAKLRDKIRKIEKGE
jgi:protein-arginine kinase activator protein McsA